MLPGPAAPLPFYPFSSRAHLPRRPLLTSQGRITSLQYVLAGSSVEALYRMALVGVHEYKVLSFNTVQEIGGCWAVERLPAAFAQALVGRVGHAWAPAPAQHILGAPLGTRHGTNTSHSPPPSTLIGAEAPSADDLAAAAATAAANDYKPRSPSILTMHHLSCVTTTLEDAVEYDRCPLAEGVLADLERRYPNEPAPLRLWRALCDPGARFTGWLVLGGVAPGLCRRTSAEQWSAWGSGERAPQTTLMHDAHCVRSAVALGAGSLMLGPGRWARGADPCVCHYLLPSCSPRVRGGAQDPASAECAGAEGPQRQGRFPLALQPGRSAAGLPGLPHPPGLPRGRRCIRGGRRLPGQPLCAPHS